VKRNLIATGCVEDYPPYQRAADIGICPIRYGGGTKIKLLESLAGGLPTVAFAASIEGTNLLPDEHLLIADENETALLEALHSLADDRELSERLGAAARRHILAHHDWTRIAEKLEAALLQLVESS
jgi:glycosyltransferase involved in cell wall biosynthesis